MEPKGSGRAYLCGSRGWARGRVGGEVIVIRSFHGNKKNEASSSIFPRDRQTERERERE
jgi:hypothetical protein